MTLEEKAREVAEEIGIQHGTHLDCDDSCSKKGVAVGIIAQALRDARKEALEEAANVADARVKKWGDRNAGNAFEAAEIGLQIRALSASEPKEGK